MTATCPLCDRLRASPIDDVVWRFPRSVALLGPWQYYTGYCILVARTHAAELHHLPRDECRAFLEEMTQMGAAIDACFQPRKLNCESLGNQVQHLHWHLFPRRADDPKTLQAVWLALERADKDEAEKRRLQTGTMPRHDIIQRLRSELAKHGPEAP